MGVWQPSPRGRQVAQSAPELKEEFFRALPDLTPGDIGSSPYSVKDYTVNPAIGGDEGLREFRMRLRARNLRLMLDLVPNHFALDNEWVTRFPERFVQGTAADLDRAPQNFYRAGQDPGGRIFAHGRDPYFDGWRDTVQINIFSPEMRQAMIELILALATVCDGIRCDMAMLLMNRIFKNTWKNRVGEAPAVEFWAEAIQAVKSSHPEFIFLAECYWDLEWEMQQLGFDFTYDKKLYDRLREGNPEPVRLHLGAAPDYQDHLARMIENHDEARAAAVFEGVRQKAAAVITFGAPGLRFFHEGQLCGRKVKVPVQLRRRPAEPPDPEIVQLYNRILSALSDDCFLNGTWRQLDAAQAWQDNRSHRRLIAYWWSRGGQERLVAANLSGDPSQGYIPMPISSDRGRDVRLRDLISDRVYDRNAEDLRTRGLYLALGGFDAHLFRIESPPLS